MPAPLSVEYCIFFFEFLVYGYAFVVSAFVFSDRVTNPVVKSICVTNFTYYYLNAAGFGREAKKIEK